MAEPVEELQVPAFNVTRSEHRVIEQLLHDGPGNAEIASRLDLTQDTIKTHIRRMFSKLEQAYPDAAPVTRTSFCVHILHGRVRFTVGETPTSRPRRRRNGHESHCRFNRWQVAGEPRPSNDPGYTGPVCNCNYVRPSPRTR
jgi:hypothetical protein